MLPVVYALLPDKSAKTYIKLLTEVANLGEDIFSGGCSVLLITQGIFAQKQLTDLVSVPTYGTFQLASDAFYHL